MVLVGYASLVSAWRCRPAKLACAFTIGRGSVRKDNDSRGRSRPRTAIIIRRLLSRRPSRPRDLFDLRLLNERDCDTLSRVGRLPPEHESPTEKPRHPRVGVSFALVSSSPPLRVRPSGHWLISISMSGRTSGDHHSPRMVGHCCFHKRRIDRQDYL
jgi:hypothetical protein